MSEQDFVDNHRLSMANEDYLESICRITIAENSSAGIRSVDVADQLNVSKASVNKAISTLKDAGYVEQNRYGRVILTEAGREYASEVWHAHRLIRAFLEEGLGVAPEVANEEACTMEHALSRDTLRRWAKFLADQGFLLDQNENVE